MEPVFSSSKSIDWILKRKKEIEFQSLLPSVLQRFEKAS